MNITIKTDSLAGTQRIAEALAAALKGGEVIELRSDIGGGKTTFVKAVAKSLGITDAVQSPTFTISRLYKAPSGLQLHHFDFYRLNNPGIMREELAESLHQPDVVVMIEWADIVESVLPTDHIIVTIKNGVQATDREFIFTIPDVYASISQALLAFRSQRSIA